LDDIIQAAAVMFVAVSQPVRTRRRPNTVE
jgi:hypothetical protein